MWFVERTVNLAVLAGRKLGGAKVRLAIDLAVSSQQ
jgi:hypothetical protein